MAMKLESRIALGMGILGLLGGPALRLFRPGWSTYADAAMAIGALALVAFLYVERAEVKRLAGVRQARFGANVTAYTLIVAAILGFLNYVGSRHVKRIDLTDEKLHTLSPQTVKVLRSLKKEVKATAFFRSTVIDELARTSMEHGRDLLQMAGREAPLLKVEIVDPDRNPGRAESMQVRLDQTTVLECGSQKSTFTGASEEDLVNALVKVTRETQSKIYVLEGEGELDPDRPGQRAIAKLKEQLVDKSYLVEKCNLQKVGEVPRDAALLVAADPRSPLPERSLELLRRYLDEGGRLLCLLDARHDSGMSKLLDQNGIVLGNDIVVDPTMGMLGGPAEAIALYGEMFLPHAITNDFPFTAYMSLARSVTAKATPPPDVTARPLCQTTADGWADSDVESNEVRFDPEADKRGPITLAVAATWKARGVEAAPAAGSAAPSTSATPSAPETPTPATASPAPSTATPAPSTATPAPGATTPAPASTPPAVKLGTPGASGTDWLAKPSAAGKPQKRYDEARLCVVGDADVATDPLVGNPRIGNGPLLMNMANWLCESESLIAVPPKKPKNYTVQIGVAQGITISLLTLVVIPGGVLIYGLGCWWRRRKL